VNLALLVPDGVGARNFLLGSFLGDALLAGPVAVLHVLPDDLLPRYASRVGDGVEWQQLFPSGHGRIATTLRNSLGYAHMYRIRTRAMQLRLGRPVRSPSLGRWAMTQTARLIGRAAASRGGIAALEEVHRRVARRDPVIERYRRLFRALQSEVLFCTHQRPPDIIAPVLAARSLGIPTATFIFSWDNLCSKGRIAAPFDHYLVWSEHMRDEFLQHYPEVSRDRTYVVGTPQFDPYADPGILCSREEFFRRIGADPARKLICFSGGDVATCPEDPLHLCLLLEQIRDGRIRGDPQVVLRPSPVDNGDRYQGLRREFPELRYAPPVWVHPTQTNWSRVIPLPEDVALLANLTWHCDLNVNTASTMTLDFATRDRPVVNIAFDIVDPPPLGVPLHDLYYRFEHYRPVVELGAARIARSPSELAEHVSSYLADPTIDREGRRRLVELEVGIPLGQSANRIVRVLQRIAALPAVSKGTGA
jgi:hypothetical protein